MKINVLDISFEYNGTSQTINPVIIQDNETMILVDTGYPDQIGLLEESAKQNDISLDKLTHIEYITPNVPLVSLTNVPDISLLNVPLFTGCN